MLPLQSPQAPRSGVLPAGEALSPAKAGAHPRPGPQTHLCSHPSTVAARARGRTCAPALDPRDTRRGLSSQRPLRGDEPQPVPRRWRECRPQVRGLHRRYRRGVTASFRGARQPAWVRPSSQPARRGQSLAWPLAPPVTSLFQLFIHKMGMASVPAAPTKRAVTTTAGNTDTARHTAPRAQSAEFSLLSLSQAFSPRPRTAGRETVTWAGLRSVRVAGRRTRRTTEIREEGWRRGDVGAEFRRVNRGLPGSPGAKSG